MSLALVGDRKDIQPQNSAASSVMECTFPPLLFHHHRPFSCLRRTWWDGIKESFGMKIVLSYCRKLCIVFGVFMSVLIICCAEVRLYLIILCVYVCRSEALPDYSAVYEQTRGDARSTQWTTRWSVA